MKQLRSMLCILLALCLTLTPVRAAAAAPEASALPAALNERFENLPAGANYGQTDYRKWAQGDPRWSSLYLGKSTCTVAKYGCLVTSVTKLVIQAGFRDPAQFDVGTMVGLMNDRNGFTSTGAMYWAKPAECISGLKYHGQLLTNGTYSAADYNDKLLGWVRQGYHLILAVKSKGHWVAVDEAKTLKTGTVHIMDSLNSSPNADITLESRYATFNVVQAYKGGTTPEVLPVPGIPENLRTHRSVYSPAEPVTLSWDPVPHTELYRLTLWKDGAEIMTVQTEAAAFTADPLPCGDYSWTVRAENRTGAGSDSGPYSMIVTDLVPAAVTGIRSGKTTFSCGDVLQLEWDASYAAEEYWVCLWKDGEEIAFVTTGKECVYEAQLPTAGAYLVLVMPANVNGSNDSGEGFSFAVEHENTYLLTAAPTLSEPGILTGTCAGCAGTTDISLPALNETDYTYTVTAAPTCTEPGMGSYVWEPDFRFDVPLASLGHDYQNGVCTRCGEWDREYPVASGWSGDLTWTLDRAGTLTFSGNGKMRNYIQKTVMPWYPLQDRIVRVVLEPGVTSVGDFAFYGMDIESIEIPQGVTAIGQYAFKNAARLDGVKLPDTLTQLGESAFYGCTGLTAIDIPASLYTVRPYTFKNCANLGAVTFQEGNLQKISDGAFYATALEALVLPDCLDIVDVYAFKNCTRLSSITLGMGLTELREAVFYGTAIPAITIPEGITKIGPYAFKDCVKLQTIDLPESLTSLGESGFYGCTAMEKLDLPSAVKKIDGYAFKNCTGLRAVSLPDSLEKLGDSAFHTCTGLPEITIPGSVTGIGSYCFSGSTGIKSITFQGDAPAIGTGAFRSVSAGAHYPADNLTWTPAVRQSYGGILRWIAK